MKTRNEIYGGTFSSPEAPDTNANGELKKLVLSDSGDITKNRTSWIRTILYNILDSFTHKTEDRATSANLGVSGAEPTTTKYVTVEQLPSVDKTTNDFTGVAGSGTLVNNQNTIDITPVLTGTGKSFIGKLHADFVAWLLARTYSSSELTTAVTTIVNNPSGGGLIPVGTIWDYAGTDSPDGFLNLCAESGGSAMKISKGSGTGNLHDDKYEALYLKLHANYANTECPVDGGRGASAAADWAAGKYLTLPDYRGRVGGYYKLSDTNFGTLGKQIGAEIIDATKLPVISPWTASDSGHTHGAKGKPDEDGNAGATNFGLQDGTGNTATTNSSSANISMSSNTGGGQKHFQPTIIQTAIIKY